MTSTFDENHTVRDWLVTRLSGLGWTPVEGKDLARTTADVMIEGDVRAALIRLNPQIASEPTRADELIALVRAQLDEPDLLTANEWFTRQLKGHATHRFVGMTTDEPVRFIDFDSPESNTLFVSREVTYGAGHRVCRFDVVLWVNGFPLVVIEAKTPVNASKSWLNGANDFRDIYQSSAAEFFAPNLMLAATEGRELHYGAIESEPSSWQMWGSTADPYDSGGYARLCRSVDLLLSPASVCELLGSFTYFHATESARFKILPRYPQVEAARAIHQRVRDGGRRGLIWHFQGTGKTLLMAFAANLILDDPAIPNPTVLVVLDRIDLVGQTMRQFRALGTVEPVEARNREELRTLLARGRTGIIVTTVFRFSDTGELSGRDNVIVLIDEAHRTQEGGLGQYMRAALPNARYFGLTGTPINYGGRDTFDLFGDPDDPDRTLSEYSMERSIHDGASVPVHVEPRMVAWQLDSESLDAEFAEMAAAENLTEDERDKLVRRVGRAATIVRNPERITAVCTDILDHFATKVAPLGLKAQVVAYDRELVVAYEQELNRIIAGRPDYDFDTEVVMTAGAKTDPPEWKADYELSRGELEAVVRRFKTPGSPPHLLIVTAKLLTGFDAPIEGAMYLDKPLSKHTLFQAITRTNRRYCSPITGHDKRYGLIVDYIGLGPAIAEALRRADPDRQGTRPVDVAGLYAEFAERLTRTLARFDGIDRAATLESLHAARTRVQDPEALRDFAADFIGLQTIWEALAPDPQLQPHEHDYRWLAGIYESSRPPTTSDALLWARLGAKTREIVHRNMREIAVGAHPERVVIDAESIDVLRSLADDDDPDAELTELTVDAVMTSIERRIKRRLDSTGEQIYLDLSVQIEKLRELAIHTVEDSVTFMQKALELARRVVQADKLVDEGHGDEATRILDPHIGALTQIVEQYKPPELSVVIEDVVRDIDNIVRQSAFTGWTASQAGDREVRKELRRVLHKHALPVTGELYDRAYAYIRENY